MVSANTVSNASRGSLALTMPLGLWAGGIVMLAMTFGIEGVLKPNEEISATLNL